MAKKVKVRYPKINFKSTGKKMTNLMKGGKNPFKTR